MRNIEIYKNRTNIGEVKEIKNKGYVEAFLSATKLDDFTNLKHLNVEVHTAKGTRRIKLKFGECLLPILKDNHATVQLTDLLGQDFTVKVVSAVCDKGTVTTGQLPVSVSILLVR